jgi:hypothetical protein
VREQRVLDRRRGLARGGDDRDVVDLLEALDAAALTRAVVAADVQAVAITAAGLGGRLLGLVAAGRRDRGGHILLIGGADVDHEAARAAVVEEAVDRVGEVHRAVLEVTKGLYELRPVGDEHGFVVRPLARLTEEPDRVRANGLDGLRAAIDLFYVNTWREITGGHPKSPPCLAWLDDGVRWP